MAYNEDEERDENGRWTGGGESKSDAKPERDTRSIPEKMASDLKEAASQKAEVRSMSSKQEMQKRIDEYSKNLNKQDKMGKVQNEGSGGYSYKNSEANVSDYGKIESDAKAAGMTIFGGKVYTKGDAESIRGKWNDKVKELAPKYGNNAGAMLPALEKETGVSFDLVKHLKSAFS